MKAILKNRPLTLLVIGVVLMGTSPAWEYARVRPDYPFLVSPWSMRGYEFTQGLVIAACSAAILVLALLLSRGVVKETTAHAAGVVAFVTLFATGVGIATGIDGVVVGGLGLIMLAFLGASVLGIVGARFYAEGTAKWIRNASKVGIWLVGTAAILLGILRPLFGGKERPLWLVLLVVFAILGTFTLLRPPRALAPWRSVINSIFAVWIIATTMASSLRAELSQLQFATNGVGAEVTDIGITSGVLIAWGGGLLALVGAIGLWAKRRDEIAAHERARRQQEAARESEKQLAGV